MATQVPVLPEELLRHIMSEWEPHEFGRRSYVNPRGSYYLYQRTLRSLVRVNRQFHRLAQPLLYQSIATKGHDRPWVLRLVRTLLEQPKLADHVRNVWMPADSIANDEPPEELINVDPELIPSITQRVGQIGNRALLSDRLLAKLRDGDGPACMAVLLLIARNITFLHLQIPSDWKDSFVAEIVDGSARRSYASDATAAKPDILQSVETLRLEHWGTEGSTDLKNMSNLIRLPSLKVCRGHMLQIGQDMRAFGNWPCNVTSFELTYSVVEAPGLETLLRCCSNVQNLAIAWGDAIVGDCEISWPRFGDTLRQHAKSLKFLRLDATTADPMVLEPPIPPLGDLRPLARLEKLAVHPMCLLGEDDEVWHVSPSDLANVLPESLAELTLFHRGPVKGTEEKDQGLRSGLIGLKSDKRFEALKIIGLKRILPP